MGILEWLFGKKPKPEQTEAAGLKLCNDCKRLSKLHNRSPPLCNSCYTARWERKMLPNQKIGGKKQWQKYAKASCC